MKILYEDRYIVAINKPAGVLVHSDGGSDTETVVKWVRKTYPEVFEKKVGEPFKLRTGEFIDRPGIVHRLDKETSGVLLIAKTQESFLHLKKQFQEHTIQKTYHAFVHGFFKESEGHIDRPIGKSRSDFRKWSAERGARGVLREAITLYKILTQDKTAAFVEVYPKTGRTHQIRVHFKAINHPVVCDKLYAPKRPCLLGFERLALHARSITFKTLNNEDKTVMAPYPADFEKAMELRS